MHKSNIDWLSLACAPAGTKPATQACALTGNRTCNLSVYRTTPNQPSYTGQGRSPRLMLSQKCYRESSGALKESGHCRLRHREKLPERWRWTQTFTGPMCAFNRQRLGGWWAESYRV